MRRWGIIAAVAAVAIVTVVLTVSFASRFGSDPQLAPSPLIGRPVPEITVQRVDDGSDLALHEMTGDIVVINFWAPWCLPCRDEHPDLVSIAEAYGPSGVRVLGITYQSDIGHVIQYLDELGWGYEVAMDDRSRAAIAFGIRGVPETFFVDRTGEVVAKINGPVTAEIMAATIDRIMLGVPVDDETTTGTVQPTP